MGVCESISLVASVALVHCERACYTAAEGTGALRSFVAERDGWT
jgi:hypothetical protein